MPKLLLPIAAGLALAGATAGGATYLLTRGEAVEEVPPSVQATATPSPSATGTPEVSPTAAPTRAPMPSPSPVPDDWKTYTDPGGLFTVRYPPDWFQKDGSLYSFDIRSMDLDTWSRADLPPEFIEVEMGYTEAARSRSCGGSLDLDPETGQSTVRPEATPASLSGVSGGEIVREPGDAALADPEVRVHGWSAIHKGYCFLLTAYFYQAKQDEETVLQIVNSFEFANFPAID